MRTVLCLLALAGVLVTLSGCTPEPPAPPPGTPGAPGGATPQPSAHDTKMNADKTAVGPDTGGAPGAGK